MSRPATSASGIGTPGRNRPRSPRSRSARRSSSGGFCCTCCRPASTAFATTACSAIAIGPRSWPAVGNCSECRRHAPPTPPPDYRDHHESAHRRVAAHVPELRRRTHDGGRDRATRVHTARPHRYVMTRPTASTATLRAAHDGRSLSRVPLSRRLDSPRALQASDFARRRPPGSAQRRPPSPSHATALRPRSTAGPIQSP